MEYVLKLFVTGQTSRSRQSIQSLNEIQQRLGKSCQVVIIDVLEHPELAEKNKILATPTLIKELPSPLRRVIGDLSDVDTVLASLDI